MSVGEHSSAKAAVRARLLAARRAMGEPARSAAAAALTARLLGLPDLATARTVAAYVSFGTEPPTSPALATLASRGVRVLLPVLRADQDLDWAIYGQPHLPPQERPHLWTPPPPWLGVEAVAAADAVVVPAVAVGSDGTRLGRGGGSYDRALSRVPGGTPVITLLYAGELLDHVPAEAHDRRVTVAVLPDATHRFPVTSPPAP